MITQFETPLSSLFCISVYCHLQEFTSTGSANTETSKVSGSLETKYKWAEHGVTFTEKWNTDNTLGTEITVEDQVGDTRIDDLVRTLGFFFSLILLMGSRTRCLADIYQEVLLIHQ